MSRHAAAHQPGAASGRQRCHRPDSRRKWHRQGNPRRRDPWLERPRGQALCHRRLPGGAICPVARERIVRPRPRRVHWPVRDNPGRIAAADGGTLFLDEIGDLPLELQPKLLRFVQDRAYERVGEPRTRRADVRLIAATNIDLDTAVRQGRFREDLLYRVQVMQIDLPPLRERRDDIDAPGGTCIFWPRRRPRRVPALSFTPPAEAALRALALAGQCPRIAQRRRTGPDPLPDRPDRRRTPAAGDGRRN